ncbi:MAG: hypothetical protein J7474_00325 [Arthrobacter sp.]|nr:hypothetical protein [Arthrobacter sp.]
MVYDRERDRRDQATRAFHKEALARGEKRSLYRTKSGELYSYAQDEIGFGRIGLGPKVGTWVGMAVLALLMIGLFFVSLYMLLVPRPQDDPSTWKPFWGALWLTALSLGGTWLTVRFTILELKARAVRRERGVPEPA